MKRMCNYEYIQGRNAGFRCCTRPKKGELYCRQHKVQVTCPICLVDNLYHKDHRVILPCKHRYHKECLERWQQQKRDLKCSECIREQGCLSREYVYN